MQKFHEAQLVAAPTSPEFYRIHAFLYEVQAQAAWADVFQRAAAELAAVNPDAAIFQYNLKSGPARPVLSHLYAAEGYLDRLVRLSSIAVTNDVRQRLVDRQNHGPAVRLGKSQSLRELPERISDDAKSLRIAAQFHSEK